MWFLEPEAFTQWGLQDPTRLSLGTQSRTWGSTVATKDHGQSLSCPWRMLSQHEWLTSFLYFSAKCLSQASGPGDSPIPWKCAVVFVSWPRWPEQRGDPDWVIASLSVSAVVGSILLGHTLSPIQLVLRRINTDGLVWAPQNLIGRQF